MGSLSNATRRTAQRAVPTINSILHNLVPKLQLGDAIVFEALLQDCHRHCGAVGPVRAVEAKLRKPGDIPKPELGNED
jgi:hypothetical protein